MQTVSEWNGFRRIDFLFEDKEAILVCPETPIAGNKWLFKTEYFGAFPAFELEMLARGYHVAHVKNTTRWCLDEDTERQARFAKFLHEEYGLAQKCMTVGMSCGGMQSIYLAAKHPETVAALYIDAPVTNLLSCPCRVGRTGGEEGLYEEFVKATGKTISDMINYRRHPIDFAPALVAHNIPLYIVAGDSDKTVPYDENGAHLANYYRENGGILFETVKKDCDHHPHGLTDHAPLIRFAEEYYTDL